MKLAVLATVLLASSPAHADQEDPFDGGTITAQAGIGGIAGIVGGGAMGLLGAGVGHLMDPRDIGMPLAGAVLGFATGAAIGVVWSVDYVGDDRGANGTLLATGLGAVAGVGLWIGMQLAVDRAGKNMPFSASVLTAIVAGLGGPIVGYHLTADEGGRKTKRISVPIVGLVF